ncbi:MAG: hypothetical protein HY820_10840 [Acidobacteria bacterium]|nr:hypothetical protein [Acidobacteriota bacterium]
MFVSLTIIGFSLLLFLYWFRYTCLLILSTRTTKDYTAQVAKANQLEFPLIQAHLRDVAGAADQGSLEALRHSLERDYRLLTGLLSHAAQFQVGGLSAEQRMLMVDYQAMRLWYRVSMRFAKGSNARNALEEMADIVAHFANAMGERSVSASRA